MHLFITGGGDQESFRQLDKKFLNGLPKGAKIVVIPLATEGQDYQDVLERAEECFDSSSVDSIDLCEDIQKLNIDKLREYDAVFFEGGNTFKLIQELRHCSFFSDLQTYLKENKYVYADSAGAIVLGRDVQSALMGDEPDDDEEKLQSYRGLGVLGEWSIHCHYEGHEDEQLQDLMYNTGFPILALPEPCGIYTDGTELEVIGESALVVFSFSGRQSLPSGTKIKLDELH